MYQVQFCCLQAEFSCTTVTNAVKEAVADHTRIKSTIIDMAYGTDI